MKNDWIKRIALIAILLYILGAVCATYYRNQEVKTRDEEEESPVCNAYRPIRQRLDRAENYGILLEHAHSIKYFFISRYPAPSHCCTMACSDLSQLTESDKDEETAEALDRAKRLEAINRSFLFWLFI